ncbi:MAG: tRNA uridine-5-carboxymethylaminomethyl(34) synthesis enzyme MnmG [Thermodesulfobacteriota bacterium]|nr:tRNA uridine-5-carboxymethylaminomethyl(34) synthesis enzyme MnmG [Thermodesulfobacteriota bacterium]
MEYDVIVVGGGHAGCEAALAPSRMGCKTLLVTMNLDGIGFMPCNPAVGGIAKGQLVREIDALGGEIGKNTDRSAIQYRLLNTRKGPAVRSTRAQVDRQLYRSHMKEVLEHQENLFLKQAHVNKLLVSNDSVYGVETDIGERFIGKSIILTTGTFLNGFIHIGLTSFPGGMLGGPPSVQLSECLKNLGFKVGRLKTGTTPRLDKRTINVSGMEIQNGDDAAKPFSINTETFSLPQLPCYITYTNPRTHEIIRNGLDRSPLYQGIIKAKGVRYCPSIEDKIVRFPERERHQVFIEPDGLHTIEVYPNGIPTSLPIDVQEKMVRSIDGLENAEIIRPGYGIEYDFVNPLQLSSTLETKIIKNLYLAGQINGTTGYEEAAAQGIIAGINAACKVKGKAPFILDRSEAYIAVLIDDLVTKGTNEPYRMFTSRAEYRLILREDNADVRLRGKGYQLGLVGEDEYKTCMTKIGHINEEMKRLKEAMIYPNEWTNKKLKELKTAPLTNPVSVEELLRRPEIMYEDLCSFLMLNENLSINEMKSIEIEVKYKGYIERQNEQVARFKKLEEVEMPEDIQYENIHGLSNEVVEKLTTIRPLSLGQATRISGITPSAIDALSVFLKKMGKEI